VVGEADVTPAGPDAVPVVVRPLQESLRQNPQATAAAPDASEEFIAIVYTPDGDTAREAQVALPGPGFSFRLVPGRLVAGSEQNSSSIVQVDAEGRFKVRGRDKQRVIIADASGYTETTVQELRKNRTVRLGRWATLEGVWQTNGQPIVAAELSLQWFHRAPIGFLLDRAGFRAVTDAQGQFAFPKVPAGSLQVLAYSADHRGPVFPFPKIAEVELLPGDTQRLLITNPPPAPTQPLVLGDSIPAGKFWLNGADAASQGLMIYRDLSGVPVEADPEVLRHHTKVYFTNSQDMSRLELLAALERIFRDQAGLVLLRTGDNRLWVRYDKSAKSLERSN
jgi:hypothetical protein